MSGSTWRFTDASGVEREVTTAELRSGLVGGSLAPTTLVWRDGMKEWVPAFTVPELASAAIAAQRGREVPRTPTARPPSPPTPIRRNRPTQTLVGIDAPSLVNKPIPRVDADAGGRDAGPAVKPGGLERSELALTPPPAKTAAGPAPIRRPTPPLPFGAVAAIPRAPKVPSVGDVDVPADATDVGASPAGLAPDGSRPKSIPPPLPPRTGRAPTPGGPQPPTRTTLTGGLAPEAGRSRPPPAPKRPSKQPPPMPPRGTTPAPFAAVAAQPERPRPPSPPKKSVPPPAEPAATTAPAVAVGAANLPPTSTSPGLGPAVAAAQAAAGAASGPPSSAAAEGARLLGESTTELAVPPQLLGAQALLATIGDDGFEENTITITRENGEILKEPRSKPAAKLAAGAPRPVSAGGAAKPKGATAARDATPKPAATAAKPAPAAPSTAKGATPADEPPADPANGSMPPRQKTLEMSLEDHQGAAASKPVPNLGDNVATSQVTEPFPFSAVVGSSAESRRSRPPEDAEGSRDREGASSPPASAQRRSGSSPPGAGTEHGYAGDRASYSDEDHLEVARRRAEAIEVPRRSIVGASLLWMVGLVTFFFVGRCAGYRTATQIVHMHGGAVKTFLTWTPPGTQAAPAAAEEPKPCWVSRQPTRWAEKASKSIPIDMEPSGTSMALGYAVSDHTGVGILIDPRSGKFDEKFREKVSGDDKDKEIALVSPLASAPNGFMMSLKSDTDVIPVGASTPFFVVFGKDSLGWADAPDHAPTQIFKLEGDGAVSAEQITETGGAGYFVSFRKGDGVFGGYFDANKSPIGELASIPASGPEGKVGKPKAAFNGDEVAIVFADLPTGDGDDWQVRLGHAKAGKVPDATSVLALPEGGPGGRKIAPDIVGLPDGRWLVMWTEGPAGGSAIRALTLTKTFEPIGDPIALSPPAGNFGQAVLGTVGGYTTVVFLQAGDEAFELWGAVLRCG